MSDCRKCARCEECIDEDCSFFVRKPMTNADRIRAMSDEELAEWLDYIGDSYYEPDGGWLEWLKQETDNEHTD